jgi:hypothetical protein
MDIVLLTFMLAAGISGNPLDFWILMLAFGYLARSRRNSP